MKINANATRNNVTCAPEASAAYFRAFGDGETDLSMRKSIAVFKLYIKKGKARQSNEEAIKELKEDRALYESNIVEVGDGTPDGQLLLALDMAIDALEKQIPKKPTFEGKGFDGNVNTTHDTWICPCCGEGYEVDYYCDDYKYCPWCGQMIDWRDFK